jgi:hypothetical protein
MASVNRIVKTRKLNKNIIVINQHLYIWHAGTIVVQVRNPSLPTAVTGTGCTWSIYI